MRQDADFHVSFVIRYGIIGVVILIFVMLLCLLNFVRIERSLEINVIRTDTTDYVATMPISGEFAAGDTLHIRVGLSVYSFKVDNCDQISKSIQLRSGKNNLSVFPFYQSVCGKIPVGKIKMWDLLFQWRKSVP